MGAGLALGGRGGPVADQHASDDPAFAGHLYADADCIVQLRKAPDNVNRDELADDARSRQ